MTDRFASTSRHTQNQTGVFRWKNTSGEEIPAFACVKLSAFNDADKYFDATKPDGEGSLYFFNGAAPIAADAYGESFIWGTSSILGLTTGEFGETVGPVADSWEMTAEGTGYTVFSNVSEGGIAAILREGGGGGGGQRIWFEITEVICNEDLTKELVVTVTHYTGGCTKAIPGEDEYGNVTIEDICGILNYYTQVWLETGGVKGSATYFYPRDGYCEPLWLVDSICGQPECA